MLPTNVYDYIIREKEAFKTSKVPLTDGWEWNAYEHIRKSFLYKNSKFTQGPDDGDRPFRNIIRPVLNVAYRSEGFDVKDIDLFVDDDENHYKSFVARKFHPRWARENDIDTFIDELVESYVDYGMAVAKRVTGARPEAVPLQRFAFFDQTDFLAGAKCELHNYSVDQLLDMKGRWYEDKIDEAIVMAEAEKTVPQADGKKAHTPSKYIEVYELHGTFPETWVDEGGNAEKYTPQLHVVTFYTSDDGRKHGITLFKGPEKKEVYKAIKRDPIFGRACGFGGIEELFESQTWTNYSEIQIREMLDQAALVIWQTSDGNLANQYRMNEIEKGHILTHEDGKPLSMARSDAINIERFLKMTERWEQNARTIGSASDPQLGLNPVSGTPLGTTEIVTDQGIGIHEYRQGKMATFVGEIYTDWVLPHLVTEMNKGQRFREELTVKELREVAEAVTTNVSNAKIKEKLISGDIPTDEEIQLFRDITKQSFLKQGTKRFFELVKEELSDLPVVVQVSIKGKQKNLALMVSKLNAIFRGVFANPAILQDEGMSDLFNQILESAGLSPINFSSLSRPVDNEEEQVPAPEPAPVPTEAALPV